MCWVTTLEPAARLRAPAPLHEANEVAALRGSSVQARRGCPGAGVGGALDDAESERQRALGRMVQAALLAGVPFGAAAVAMVVRGAGRLAQRGCGVGVCCEEHCVQGPEHPSLDSALATPCMRCCSWVCRPLPRRAQANAQLAKRSGERHWHGAAPLLAAAAAFAALAVLLNASGNGDAGAAGAFAALTAAAVRAPPPTSSSSAMRPAL